jgi:hypothetical protein
VIDRVRPGSIVLLHVWYGGNKAASDAVPAIGDGLHARGYRFVTVKELVSLSGGAGPESAGRPNSRFRPASVSESRLTIVR